VLVVVDRCGQQRERSAMIVRFGAFLVDSDRRQLTDHEGAEIHLTPKAFDLLVLLVREAPRVVRKGELHERLWPRTFVSDATLSGLVREVRRGLDDHNPNAPLIRTAHGVGYAFAGELQASVPSQTNVSHWTLTSTSTTTSIGRMFVPTSPEKMKAG
jgi:DNA-binding winged helix-turn-helix (wHTH) protein